MKYSILAALFATAQAKEGTITFHGEGTIDSNFMFMINSEEKGTGQVFRTGRDFAGKATITEEYTVKDFKKDGNYTFSCRGPSNANTYLEVDGKKYCQNRGPRDPPSDYFKVFIGTPPPPPPPMYAPDAAKEAVAGA